MARFTIPTGFYALYANVDGFIASGEVMVPVKDRIELDRWIISKLQSLIEEVTLRHEEFEPHRAARAIEEFVDEHLSNWYVRLSRRRFWRGEMSTDKTAAYETLYTCLKGGIAADESHRSFLFRLDAPEFKPRKHICAFDKASCV